VVQIHYCPFCSWIDTLTEQKSILLDRSHSAIVCNWNCLTVRGSAPGLITPLI
jgi:hypothetical protein